ncbi:IYD [Symbiodinium sp. CCMP2592]|nr:IYD [Symbiodinium sp. CCMP2592]
MTKQSTNDHSESNWIPLDHHTPDGSSLEGASEFYQTIQKRRTVRHFSDKPVPREIIQQVLLAAGTSPSGAHKQPWRFIAVSNKDIKHKIRLAVEEVEREFYEDRASERWLEDLEPFETNPDKSYIDTVPWLIIVMALRTTDDGGQVYYLNESVGIATGLLLTAAHHAGLATLTHTPSPMKFLREVLDRPEHERPYMMIPMGYPTEDCKVPDIKRKDLDELAVFIE